MMLLYQTYFFVCAFGIIYTLRRLYRLYTSGKLSYGRVIVSRQTVEALIALAILVIHFGRVCYFLSAKTSPEGFRGLWIPETLYFGYYLRGLADEKHYAALEKALHRMFAAR